jgi:hypothetical protein
MRVASQTPARVATLDHQLSSSFDQAFSVWVRDDKYYPYFSKVVLLIGHLSINFQ